MSSPVYADDNFGVWSDVSRDPDVEAFYFEVQRISVWKVCEVCKCRVKLMPQYGICNRCADDIENGRDG